MDRKLTLISDKVGELLVKQMAHELKNYNLYNNFANYFGLEGISDLEEYYKLRALEEKAHHDWILNYLTEGDYRFHYPIIEPNKEEQVTSFIDPFISTIEREIQTTQMIYAIYEVAMQEKEYMTCVWLHDKLIKEQIEEENTSRMARTIMELDADLLEKAEKILDLLK